jgi:hypothetical protein
MFWEQYNLGTQIYSTHTKSLVGSCKRWTFKNWFILRSCDRASWQILAIKPTRRTNFSDLFWSETLHVSDSSSVHRQEFFTVHTAMVYVIQVCRQLRSRIRMELSSILVLLLESYLQTCMTYTIAVCTVKNSWRWTEELSETCRISFQNKFEKLVRLVGFITRNKNWNSSCTVGRWWKDLSVLPPEILLTFFTSYDPLI